MKPYLLALAVAALALAALACEEEGGGVEQAPTPSSRAVPTPAGTPIITDSQFDFPAKGYRVRIPEGWTPRPNFFLSLDLSTDGFFGPSADGGVQPNIAVTCESVTRGTTLDQYVAGKVNLVQGLSGKSLEPQPRQVAGGGAFVLEYSPQGTPPAVDRTDVIFVTEKCGWTVGLTVPAGQRAAYQTVLDEFLASFRLLPTP